MKLVIDEKLKHRLVGLAVVLSLGAIFLPSMMKKSSQRFEHNFRVNVQLPPKPKAPHVVMTDEKEMFETIKVAKVEIPPVLDQKGSELDKEDFIQSVQAVDDAAIRIAKAERVSNRGVATKPIELALNNAAKNVVKKQTNEVVAKPAKPVEPVKVQTQAVQKRVATKPVIAKARENHSVEQKNIYAVQLASFAQFSNAQALVNKLQSQGYKANYIKTNGKRGVIYKVYVGHSPVKSDVMKVKTQLASAMQLNGLVVNTGVS
ncbi:Sporulation domain-containing protein [Legionella gratiana]|uniref:Sporulation domain-containing protein n=1 Tax=Legionella gratiana TaxID=45066 RepID=A0A378JFC4_9GAMM|nr:SPOR domain-containing protein [Legionella gratiana]KTD06623.1 Sporulation domain-containing protein [Legionella gratiana]STX45587.1 Sporulation domain-containing protein [Legionella gratiana]